MWSGDSTGCHQDLLFLFTMKTPTSFFFSGHMFMIRFSRVGLGAIPPHPHSVPKSLVNALTTCV